ncbi:hypothetical protein, partial [Streptomyces graminilatus]|uniref:hypothetical protein n=1 Tax=Streptomyces graminilatus TaxID=1464070 RepID=UPI0019D6B498
MDAPPEHTFGRRHRLRRDRAAAIAAITATSAPPARPRRAPEFLTPEAARRPGTPQLDQAGAIAPQTLS